MPLRNIPTDAGVALAELIEVRPGQVSSMGLTRDAGFDMTLLSFAAGESVSEEIYPGDVMYLVVEGAAEVVCPDARIPLSAGQVLRVEAGVEHAVEGVDDGAFKLLHITLQH